MSDFDFVRSTLRSVSGIFYEAEDAIAALDRIEVAFEKERQTHAEHCREAVREAAGCYSRIKELEAENKRLREVVTTTRSKVSRIDTLLASNEPTTPESFALPLKLCSRLIEYLDGIRAALSKENTE